jgi:hypothetical protein
VAKEVRLGEGEVDALRALSERTGDTDELAAAKEVGFRQRDFADDAVRGRITASDRERAGRLVLDVDIDDDTIGRGARLVGDPDLVEEAEIVQAALGPIDQTLL